jgi:hypothetical protein
MAMLSVNSVDLAHLIRERRECGGDRYDKEEPKMPPNSAKIPDAEIDLIRKWIEGGALETSGSTAAPITARSLWAARAKWCASESSCTRHV